MQLEPFMKVLGFEGGITAPGEARLQVQLKPEHLNGWGSAHGGLLFESGQERPGSGLNSCLRPRLFRHLQYPAAPGAV